jgi:flagellar biosynthesis protein FlhF
MRLKTFTAPDMPAALRMIRDDLGQHALILNTRKVRNAKGDPTLEITAALNEPAEPTTAVPPPAPHALPRPSTLEPQTSSLEATLKSHHLPAELVERLAAAAQGLSAAQFSPADGLEMLLHKLLPLQPLEALLPAARAQAFVGPHGAGKTSLIIRLARQWKASGAHIAMFSLDDHKLAGFEPLAQAAGIFDIPARLLTDARDLAPLAQKLGPSLRILIDTPGLSPTDRAGQRRLRQKLEALNLPLHTHLLLPAAWHGEHLALLPAAYQTLKPDTLVAARLDEALALGPLVAALAGCGLATGLSTTSPELTVPAQPLSARALAEALSQPPRQPWELGA